MIRKYQLCNFRWAVTDRKKECTKSEKKRCCENIPRSTGDGSTDDILKVGLFSVVFLNRFSFFNSQQKKTGKTFQTTFTLVDKMHSLWILFFWQGCSFNYCTTNCVLFVFVLVFVICCWKLLIFWHCKLFFLVVFAPLATLFRVNWKVCQWLKEVYSTTILQKK